MESRLNYILVGIFFFLSLIALIGFVFWFGKYDKNLDKYNPYYLYVKELPKGIRIETPVRYLGIPVGFVKSYKIIDKSVEIILWIKKDITIHKDSKVVVETQGLTGGNFFSLSQGEGMPFKNHEKAILSLESNWIEKIGDKTQIAMEQLGISLDKFNSLLNDENIHNFNTILKNLALASNSFNVTLNAIEYELKGFSTTREKFEQTLLRGDYNLRALFTPLLVSIEQNSKTLQQLLLESKETLQSLEKSPNDFLLGVRKEKLGPRE
ncbi:MlaD family protein [Helicobacter mesocricetorum]|uniref:MlaD family protein n=1 Tax=Helicobacter mesocricetorum TaxID=87012 RepID=UPI000CF0DA8F|nr:MlaD family protein [Helicobacter mesocricetorum]